MPTEHCNVYIQSEPEYDIPMDLAVVPLEKVFPHELVDPRRVDNLIQKLNTSEVFTNPPIVVRSNGHYIVLDGATRVASFKKLGYPHIIVQILKKTADYTLNTWYHVIRRIGTGVLINMLNDMPDITISKRDMKTAQADMAGYEGICYIQTVDKTIYNIHLKPEVNYLKALNKLTSAYIDASHVTRSFDNNIDSLVSEFPDLTGVVVFPVFSLIQVLRIADEGNVLPSGITRFIIPGRVLRLNANFKTLKSDMDLNKKNKWLYDLVMERLSKDQVRYYAEPIYLMDE